MATHIASNLTKKRKWNLIGDIKEDSSGGVGHIQSFLLKGIHIHIQSFKGSKVLKGIFIFIFKVSKVLKGISKFSF